jgi:hypothetical protein
MTTMLFFLFVMLSMMRDECADTKKISKKIQFGLLSFSKDPTHETARRRNPGSQISSHVTRWRSALQEDPRPLPSRRLATPRFAPRRR